MGGDHLQSTGTALRSSLIVCQQARYYIGDPPADSLCHLQVTSSWLSVICAFFTIAELHHFQSFR